MMSFVVCDDTLTGNDATPRTNHQDKDDDDDDDDDDNHQHQPHQTRCEHEDEKKMAQKKMPKDMYGVEMPYSVGMSVSPTNVIVGLAATVQPSCNGYITGYAAFHHMP